MPRPSKKVDDKVKVPVVPAPTMVHPPPAGVIPAPPIPVGMAAPIPARVIDPESFVRVRESVSFGPFFFFFFPLARAQSVCAHTRALFRGALRRAPRH